MSQSKSILLVCPACKSRRQVPRELVGQRVRCRQCTAELTVEAPADDDDDLMLADEPTAPTSASPAAASEPTQAPAAVPAPTYTTTHEAAISEDDIPLAAPPPSLISMSPISTPPPASRPAANRPPEKPIRPKAVEAMASAIETAEEYNLDKDVVETAEPPLIPPIRTDKKPRKTPAAEESEQDEYWVKPPDKITLTWLFTSGIYLFFLRRVAAAQWIVLSSFLFTSSLFFLFAIRFLEAGWMAVAGGCFALAGIAAGIAAYCYGSACLVAIIENTAYHLDKADRWPDSDFVEWIFHFVRLLYLLVVSSMFVAPLVAAAAAIDRALAVPMGLIGYHVVYPILLLSALESTSFLLPVSLPILRSLVDDWRAWLAFYAASAGLAIACFLALLLVSKQQSIVSILLSSPLTAAAWFSYARLIGRLASYIMHLDEKEKPKPALR